MIKQCSCSISDTAPQRARDMSMVLTCTVCGGVVSEEKNTEYNKYWGFSGFDEVEDED